MSGSTASGEVVKAFDRSNLAPSPVAGPGPRRGARARHRSSRHQALLAETKNPLESPFVSEAYERFTRAELLYELGRYPEALGWFDHLVESSVFEFVYLPLSHLWRGEIHNRQGDSKNAAASYKAFIDLWRDCDPELRPMVDLARQRLEGLATSTKPASAK